MTKEKTPELYKLVVYCTWWNSRGKSCGRNYRTKVYATSYNEACSLAVQSLSYIGEGIVLYTW